MDSGTAYGTSDLQFLMPTFDSGAADAAAGSSFEKLLTEAMNQTSGIES